MKIAAVTKFMLKIFDHLQVLLVRWLNQVTEQSLLSKYHQLRIYLLSPSSLRQLSILVAPAQLNISLLAPFDSLRQ